MNNMNLNNLNKLLIGEKLCINCKNYKPGLVGYEYCKIFGNIFEARTGKSCGLEAKRFKKKETEK